MEARFIPAGAGNTLLLLFLLIAPPVHPRGRGEHDPVASIGTHYAGSSPRARGTPASSAPSACSKRFIPAGAGNTRDNKKCMSFLWVHPRGRGEHYAATYSAVVFGGSSPRARGTRQHVSRARSRLRFIPAGAGNTLCGSFGEARPAVHPRGRGEHANVLLFFADLPGSSPRARGTRCPSSRPARCIRFIPAGAGNTLPPKAPPDTTAVHPRGRGEHAPQQWNSHSAPGSSPRARGTLLRLRLGKPQLRFIPAGAGNTH